MAYQGLRDFVSDLETAGELKRIREPVSAELEITEITDRISKAKGPALLFEKVEGHSAPLLINAFGSEKRMAMALGVDDIDEIEEIFGLGMRCVARWKYSWVDAEGERGYVRGVDILRVKNGAIYERLSYIKG